MKFNKTFISTLLALILPLTKGLAHVKNSSGETPKPKKKQGVNQFQPSDHFGTFKKTHENCVPKTNRPSQIEIRKSGEVHLRSQLTEGVLATIKWTGIEGWASDLNQQLLEQYGVSDCNALYCRPVSVPGGKALWLSFLPQMGSRNPIRDELFLQEHES